MGTQSLEVLKNIINFYINIVHNSQLCSDQPRAHINNNVVRIYIRLFLLNARFSTQRSLVSHAAISI